MKGCTKDGTLKLKCWECRCDLQDKKFFCSAKCRDAYEARNGLKTQQQEAQYELFSKEHVEYDFTKLDASTWSV